VFVMFALSPEPRSRQQLSIRFVPSFDNPYMRTLIE
jgi:hypothetical protein